MKKTNTNPPRLVRVADRNGDILIETAKTVPLLRDSLNLERRIRLARAGMAEPLPSEPEQEKPSGGTGRAVAILMALALAFLGGIAVGSAIHG